MRNVEHLNANPAFHLVVDSVLNRAVVNELVNKCDVVYHLAAAVGPRLIVEQPVHTIVTNLEGSEIVLDHCTRFGKRVLVASTSEVYGDHRTEEPLHEDARRVYGPTTQKRWLYADSKAMDEYLALAYRQERDLDFVIARLFNTVGPRQSGQYGMVVARFAQAAVAGLPLEIHGDGNQTRTFCHVQDTIRALQGLMDDPVDDRRDLQRRLAELDLRPRARPARARADRLALGARLRPVRPGLRARDRRHAPPRARDREDRGRDRLDARALARRDPRRRDRLYARRAAPWVLALFSFVAEVRSFADDQCRL